MKYTRATLKLMGVKDNSASPAQLLVNNFDTDYRGVRNSYAVKVKDAVEKLVAGLPDLQGRINKALESQKEYAAGVPDDQKGTLRGEYQHKLENITPQKLQSQKEATLALREALTAFNKAMN